jgi:hypothetical protein
MKPTQRELINNFHKLIYEKHEKYTPDRIPYGSERAYSGRGGKKLKVATTIAYRSHGAIRNDSLPEFASEQEYSKRVAGRNLISQKIKPIEQKYLRQWANEVGLMMDNDAFDREWNRQGNKGEAENNVYFDEKQQRWFKRNNLGYHSTYLEFFYRLSLHNQMFPEAPYALEGFVENDGQLEPVISQPHVRASKGATPVDVEKLMRSMGYQKVEGKKHDYYNKEKGIRVEDMHDENVLMDDDGNLFVVDPVIYLDDEGKRGRITSTEPLQHEL